MKASPTKIRTVRLLKTDPVVLTNWFEKRPHIHRIDGWVGEHARPQTKCGLTLPATSPIIRKDHAELFGRPCVRCFPHTRKDIGR